MQFNLGIQYSYISKDSTEIVSKNVWTMIDQCQTKRNSWLSREISLFDRIYLTKIELIR